jgi:hypothetical protein
MMLEDRAPTGKIEGFIKTGVGRGEPKRVVDEYPSASPRCATTT